MTGDRNPRDWESWIDQQIREAQEAGKFDRLPGAGRPLDLTSNPYARDRELAFKILRDAGYAPEWIELDKAIRSRLDRARTTLKRQWEWHQARLQDLTGRGGSQAEDERARLLSAWQQAVAGFEVEVTAINKQITELNLRVPSPRFQRHKIDCRREVRQLEETDAHE